MRIEVVSVLNRTPDPHRESYYRFDKFLASLSRYSYAPTLLGLGEWWGGLMTKPRRVRDWLRSGACKGELVAVTDAFDVIFTSPPDEVADLFGKRDEVMFNAEQGLWPRTDLAYAFPDVGSPWRYLNSGVIIGKPALLLQLLESMTLDEIVNDCVAGDHLHGGAGTHINPNDQAWYQYAYAARPVPMTLDYKCEIAQSMSGCEGSEFSWDGTQFKNIATGTVPKIWHFNGGAKNELMPRFLEKWGL